MTNLILHIGASKTGTTTLQRCLVESHDVLLEHGFLYPKPVNGYKHCEITPHVLGIEDTPHWLRTASNNNPNEIRQKARQAWENILEQTAKHREKTVILSSEHLYDFAKSRNFKNALHNLRRIADDITVVVYVRSPSGRYLSGRQEGLKVGSRVRPPNGYAGYHRPLKALLDRDDLRVEIHKFGRDALIGKDIVTDFASRYLGEVAMAALNRPTSDLNTSVSAEAMVILEAISTGNMPTEYRHIGPMHRHLVTHLIAEDRCLPGRQSPKYKPGVARIVHDASPDLDWLQKVSGIVFDPPQPDDAAKDMLPQDLTSVMDLCEVDNLRLDQLWSALAKYKQSPIERLERLLKKTASHRNSLLANGSDFRYFVLDIGLAPIRFALRVWRGLRRISRALKRVVLSSP